MDYFTIPGEPNAVLWRDSEGNSGMLDAAVVSPLLPGAPVWADYETWIALGHVPRSIGGEPYVPSLDEARQTATARNYAAVDAALAPILSQYPAVEVSSWSEQLAEAQAWTVDASASTPLIDALLGERDKTTLCQTIIAKADAYKAASGAVFAWRHACSNWIATCPDATALAAWKPQFPEVPA